jgi:hypothetical protein
MLPKSISFIQFYVFARFPCLKILEQIRTLGHRRVHMEGGACNSGFAAFPTNDALIVQYILLRIYKSDEEVYGFDQSSLAA